MSDADSSFVAQYKQALITAGVMLALFVVVYYLLPPGMVSFLYK